MLNYFRINDPYRLIIIFALLLLIRLPYLISSNWHTIPELSWMIVGERMNEGALLYTDIWDDIGPLSAWVYKIIDYAFGRSQLALQVIGLLLFCVQAFKVSQIALKHKIFNEINYLPTFFYALLGLVFFNIITLSPQMMGLTFILISFNSLSSHIETRFKTDGNLLNMGLYVGIASLFFFPFILMILVHIIALLFFTNTIKRRYLLLLYGLVIPLIICWLYYVWQGKSHDLFVNFFYSSFYSENLNYLDFNTILLVFGATIILFSLSAFKIMSGLGFTIFQLRIQKTMIIATLVTLMIWAFFTDKDGYDLIMFLPWISYFLTRFFLSIRKNLKRELSFLVYFISVITIYLAITYNWFTIRNIIKTDTLIVNTNINAAMYEGKKILVLGPDIQPYFFGKQATPYFNWGISKNQLQNLNYYDNLEAIDKNIRSDQPEFIIDQISLAPELFEKIPLLGAEYKMINSGLYQRIQSNN